MNNVVFVATVTASFLIELFHWMVACLTVQRQICQTYSVRDWFIYNLYAIKVGLWLYK